MPTIKIIRDNSIPAFGAWCAGSIAANDPTILLNLEVCFDDLVDEEGNDIIQTTEDKKRIVIETLMHEFGHALEEFFNLEFNEDEIERICTSYQSVNQSIPAHLSH